MINKPLYDDMAKTENGTYRVRIQDTPFQTLRNGKLHEVFSYAKALGFDHLDTITGPKSTFLEMLEVFKTPARYLSVLSRPNEIGAWEIIDGRIIVPGNKVEMVSEAREHFPLDQIWGDMPLEASLPFTDLVFNISNKEIAEQIQKRRNEDLRERKDMINAGLF